MKWLWAHKKTCVLPVIAVFFLLSLRPYNENTWSFLLGLAGWGIPIAQMSCRIKKRRGFGRFAPALSMGACGLSVWMQLYYYLKNLEHLPRADVITARGVCIAAMFLLVTTLLLNLILAAGEKDIDRNMEEDYNLTI